MSVERKVRPSSGAAGALGEAGVAAEEHAVTMAVATVSTGAAG